MNTPNTKYTFRLDIIALVILAISFAVRYWFVASGQLNLVQDEAQYWDWIRRPQLSYYSKGPLIAWVIAGWCKVFGSNELGVRFGSIIGMTGIQTALYIGVSRVWREYRLAIYVLFVAATIPLLNSLGILMTTDNPLIFCWTVAFFALAAASRNRPDFTPSDRPFIIMGICIALGILAKYMMLVFVVLATVYAIILHLRGQLPARFWRRFLLASLIGSVVGMLPILIWNMQNGWVGFKHVAKLSTGEPHPFELRIIPFFKMFGAQLALMAPWWFVFVFTGGWRAIKKSFFGPIGSFDEVYRHILQTALFFWPLWLSITLWSLKSKTEANWTAAAFMAAAILGGMALMRWWDKPARSRKARTIIIGIAAALSLLIFASPLAPVPAQYNITQRLKGWQSLGLEMQQLMESEFVNPDRVFVFSDKYDITAELAFYTPSQPIVYCAWLDDRRMNQYDLWPGPDLDKTGWDAIFVRERWYRTETPQAVQEMFESVGQPILFESSYKGLPIRKFTIQVCKGYSGSWPKTASGHF